MNICGWERRELRDSLSERRVRERRFFSISVRKRYFGSPARRATETRDPMMIPAIAAAPSPWVSVTMLLVEAVPSLLELDPRRLVDPLWPWLWEWWWLWWPWCGWDPVTRWWEGLLKSPRSAYCCCLLLLDLNGVGGVGIRCHRSSFDSPGRGIVPGR